MRAQPLAGEAVTGPLAVIGHADWNVDCCAIKADRQCLGYVTIEADPVEVAVKEYSDPALAESVETERPHPRFSSLKKSLPLSSMMMKAGKSTTSMRQIASMPSSGYSTTSTFLMQCLARFAAAPPIEPR